jgi:hypothetical protein
MSSATLKLSCQWTEPERVSLQKYLPTFSAVLTNYSAILTNFQLF